jgi:hypothetical protein
VRLKNFRTWIHCQSSCLPYKIISCYIKENDMKNLDEKIAKEYNEFLERNSFDKYSDRKNIYLVQTRYNACIGNSLA